MPENEQQTEQAEQQEPNDADVETTTTDSAEDSTAEQTEDAATADEGGDGDAKPQEGKPAEPEFDRKRAEAKIRKANNEAAGLRKRLKELEPLARKAKEAEDAQKTEVERLRDELAAKEEAVAKATAHAVKSEVRALAADLFADKTDPEAHLDLGAYVGDGGEIDTGQIEADLTDLLERKPHLGKPKPEPDRRRPAPDRTQASGANRGRSSKPEDEFASWMKTKLKTGR
jgi:hypothetical protein